MGVDRVFFRGEIVVLFQGVAKSIFPGGPTIVKFHFTNCETKRKTFFTIKLIAKYQTSKSRVVFLLLPHCSELHDYAGVFQPIKTPDEHALRKIYSSSWQVHQFTLRKTHVHHAVLLRPVSDLFLRQHCFHN